MTDRLSRLISGCGAMLVALTAVGAPNVVTFSPTLGPPGTQVKITGSGFSTATKVLFNDAVADFVASSDTSMVATVPTDGTTGPIRVTNPTGTGASAIVFMVAPRITVFSPARSATNTVVTIYGFNFTNATAVLFNNQTSVFAVTAAVSPAQIQAIVPYGATNGPITVVTPAGSAMTTNDFIVTGSAPILDDFSPAIGAAGTMVQIAGANFSNPVTVKFNGVVDSTAMVTAQTQISAQVPASATTGKIMITTAGGTVTSSNNFVVTQAPVITDFSPRVGKAGSSIVTIYGINFDPPNVITGVTIGGKPANICGQPAFGQICAMVASGATSGPVVVTNTFGFGVSTGNFVITQAPVVISADTISGPPLAPVVIRGFNFVGVKTNGGVLFNGTPAVSFVAADTQINTSVPAGATTGPITVTNSFGASASDFDFSVTGDEPRITDFTPDHGPRGTAVLISGQNFTGPVTVKFNGVIDPTATNTALTQIHATVPSLAISGPITVTTPFGTSTSTASFFLPPRLTGFNPTNGVVGSSVVITGANFVNVSDVLFNQTEAGFVVNTTNRLTAVIPTNATTGLLTVETPGGVVSSINVFHVLPNITGFNPVIGPVGTMVTINGTTFNNVSSVSFNNVLAIFSNAAPTQVTAVVPVGATTGAIRVRTPEGVAVSATNFVVTVPSDLGLNLMASAALIEPGQPLSYTILVSNAGPSIVTGVMVTNQLPVGMTFVSATSSLGNCTQSGSAVACNIGVFSNTASATITINVNPAVEGVMTDSATVSSVESDLRPTNNTAFTTTTVVSNQSRTLGIGLGPNPGLVSISWPTSAVTFTLQSIDVLGSSNMWMTVTNAVNVSAGRNTVTNSTADASRFYRLQRP